MSLARHGSGAGAALRAYGSQVHPVFMLPPVATSWFGAALAGGTSLPASACHATAIFAAVYTAHVKDGYVDFHHRDEDDDHPLTVRGCRVGLVGAALLFSGALAGVFLLAGPLAAALTAPTWAIGYLHAPQLDMNPVTATAGYPLGISLALLGGYATTAGRLAVRPLAFAAVFLVLLLGVKVIDDATDVGYDRSIGKRTVAVVLGRARARRLAYGLMAAAMLGVVGFGLGGLFPTGTLVAAVAFGAVAAVASRAADPELATMLLVRGAYLFLAVLLVAVWYRPLG